MATLEFDPTNLRVFEGIPDGVYQRQCAIDITTGNIYYNDAATGVWTLVPATGSGTVTNIASGNGLTGGPITSTGTLSATTALINDSINYAADSGSTDTYAITLSPVPVAYVIGAVYRFKANTANTGAATINVNTLGAKTIVKVAGGITTALADNDIRVGQIVDLVYDGTNMQMMSLLGNAPVSSPSAPANSVQFNNSSAFGGSADFTWSPGLVIGDTTTPANFAHHGIRVGSGLGLGVYSIVTGTTPIAFYGIAQATTAQTTATGVIASVEATAALTDSFGVHVFSGFISGAGSITNNYGLYIADQDAGTNNWAIKTGLGTNYFGDTIILHRLTAPTDGELSVGDIAFWFDDTNGAAKLMLKAKQADGTVKTGSVNVTT